MAGPFIDAGIFSEQLNEFARQCVSSEFDISSPHSLMERSP